MGCVLTLVNTLQSISVDNTDSRSGGCLMSWSLSIPYGSLQWIYDVQLCLIWYPDGDDGQCGGDDAKREGRELCARDEWTTHYRDDTDERRGGCRMSWELRV